MSNRAHWVKLWDDWYSSRSHEGLSGVALAVGPVLMLFCASAWDTSQDEAWAVYDTGMAVSTSTIARRARFSVKEVERALGELASVGTVRQREDGAWGFPNFRKWQESAKAASMRASRDRERKEHSGNSSGTVTADVGTNQEMYPTQQKQKQKQKQKQNFDPPVAPQGAAPKPKRSKSAIPDKWRKAAETLWERQEAMRAVVPGLRHLAATDERLTRIAAVLQGGATEDDCVHVLSVYQQNALLDPGQKQWFNGDTHWVSKNFQRALGQPLPQSDASKGHYKHTGTEEYRGGKVDLT